MITYVDPGTGDVPGADSENAVHNMEAFAREVAARHNDSHLAISGRVDREDGRSAFELCGPVIGRHLIDMPGLPLDQVRFVEDEGQDIWKYPRLFVDGKPWLWKYAVNVCAPERNIDMAPTASAVGEEHAHLV